MSNFWLHFCKIDFRKIYLKSRFYNFIIFAAAKCAYEKRQAGHVENPFSPKHQYFEYFIQYCLRNHDDRPQNYACTHNNSKYLIPVKLFLNKNHERNQESERDFVCAERDGAARARLKHILIAVLLSKIYIPSSHLRRFPIFYKITSH